MYIIRGFDFCQRMSLKSDICISTRIQFLNSTLNDIVVAENIFGDVIAKGWWCIFHVIVTGGHDRWWDICPLCKSRQCKLPMESKVIVKLRIFSVCTLNEINHFNELSKILTKKFFVTTIHMFFEYLIMRNYININWKRTNNRRNYFSFL